MGFTVLAVSYTPLLFRILYDYATPAKTFSKMITDAAFISFAWLIVSGFRQGYLRSLFTPNMLGKVHNTLGLVAAYLVILHPMAVSMLYKDWTVVLPFISGYGLLVALGSISLLLLVLTVIASHIIRKKYYEIWNLLHYLNYVFFVMIFIHGLVSLPLRTPTGIYYIFLFSFCTVAMLTKFFFDLKWLSFKSRIIDNRKVADNIYNITFAVKPTLLRMWEPGQYVMLGVSRMGDNHPMSLSRINEDSAEVTFKVVGNFTRVLSHLKKDNHMFITGAYGTLYKVVKDTTAPLVFIAGGIGITPFRSIISHELENYPDREIHLFFCAKDESSFAFNEDFMQLAVTHKNFHYLEVCEATAGYLTIKTLQQHLTEFSNKQFFICGPDAMREALMEQLEDVGVSKDDIAYEEFGY